jgi:ketosteroid isomerase-like protein
MLDDSSSKASRELCLNTAKRFAKALDLEDYPVAIECLEDDCLYTIADDQHRGPSAIVDSYRASGDWAREHLDGIAYESSLRWEDGQVVVHFVDHLTHAGRRFTHRCEQVLEFSDPGRIVAIEHRDLPGEREALSSFFEAVGISRGKK